MGTLQNTKSSYILILLSQKCLQKLFLRNRLPSPTRNKLRTVSDFWQVQPNNRCLSREELRGNHLKRKGGTPWYDDQGFLMASRRVWTYEKIGERVLNVAGEWFNGRTCVCSLRDCGSGQCAPVETDECLSAVASSRRGPPTVIYTRAIHLFCQAITVNRSRHFVPVYITNIVLLSPFSHPFVKTTSLHMALNCLRVTRGS